MSDILFGRAGKDIPEGGMVGFGNCLESALSGVEIVDSPLTDKEKHRLDKQDQALKQEEIKKKEAENLKTQEFMNARKKAVQNLRAGIVTEEPPEGYFMPPSAISKRKASSPRTSTQNHSIIPSRALQPVSEAEYARSVPASGDVRDLLEREEDPKARAQIREQELLKWMKLVKENCTSESCVVQDYKYTIHLDRFVRGFQNCRKYLFSDGYPMRPFFFAKDKTSEDNILYPAWSYVPANTTQLEFGIQRQKRADGQEFQGAPKKYFAVRIFDAHLGLFTLACLIYERYENEFDEFEEKLKLFFADVNSSSRIRFVDIRKELERHLGRVFMKNDATPEVNRVINQYINAGGTAKSIKTIALERGKSKFTFQKDSVFLIVNTSMKKCSAIDPEAYMKDKVSGFERDANGNVTCNLSYPLVIVRFSPVDDMSFLEPHTIEMTHGASL